MALAFAARDTFAAETLPILSPCKQTAAPELPARWRAVGLMMPFTRDQVDVGEFIYDADVPAMRATLNGMESGAVDLLITDKETYQLLGPRDAPDACIALGKKYTLPGRGWLNNEAVCDGEAPLWKTDVQWWKTPAPEGHTNWQWYKIGTGLPWRTMFSARSASPAVIGDYGMTYFPTFTPVKDTNLARLQQLCSAKSKPAASAAAAATTARELMATAPDMPKAARDERNKTLIPGLSLDACSKLSVPRWPQQFVMTGILSPILFKWTPLPTMLYYDWENDGTFFGLMHEAQTRPPKLELMSMMKNGIGYSLEKTPSGAFACAASSPGAVRPDWMSVAGCDCKAAIDHNPDFDPDEITQIRACPVKNQGQRVNWTWYTAAGRPILFTEPAARGSGLNIADYLGWWPGAKMPPESLELPRLCTHPAEAGMPPVGNGLPASATTSCSDCHTTRQ